LRLDDEAAPAHQIEIERHVVGHRMAAADIHIGAGRLTREQQGQVVVLEVLGVGEFHVSRPRSRLPCCHDG
jgi:hypothetical protein